MKKIICLILICVICIPNFFINKAYAASGLEGKQMMPAFTQSDYIPQGFTICTDMGKTYKLTSCYWPGGNYPSCIEIYDENNKHIKRVYIVTEQNKNGYYEDNAHFGGMVAIGKYLYIASTKRIYIIRIRALFHGDDQNIVQGVSVRKMKPTAILYTSKKEYDKLKTNGKLEKSAYYIKDLPEGINASFVTVDEKGYLWIGEYFDTAKRNKEGRDPYIYKCYVNPTFWYQVTYQNSKTKLPLRIQGATFIKQGADYYYNSTKYLVLTQTNGTSYSNLNIYEARLNVNTYIGKILKTYNIFAGAEDIHMSGYGNLYVNFESGNKKFDYMYTTNASKSRRTKYVYRYNLKEALLGDSGIPDTLKKYLKNNYK